MGKARDDESGDAGYIDPRAICCEDRGFNWGLSNRQLNTRREHGLNQLEQAICDGVVKAQKLYVKMNYYWLHHAPESFLSTIVGIEIAKTMKRSVYLDTSLTRIAKERKAAPDFKHRRGRPASIPNRY
jgi:hypothetical protein